MSDAWNSVAVTCLVCKASSKVYAGVERPVLARLRFQCRTCGSKDTRQHWFSWGACEIKLDVPEKVVVPA